MQVHAQSKKLAVGDMPSGWTPSNGQEIFLHLFVLKRSVRVVDLHDDYRHDD